MKKLIFIVTFLLLLSPFSFSQNIYFNKRIDITGDYDVCRGILPFNRGYLVAGGEGEAIVGIYLSHLDSLGNLKWTQYYDNPSYTYFFGLSGALFQTKDNFFALCGSRVLSNSYGILI